MREIYPYIKEKTIIVSETEPFAEPVLHSDSKDTSEDIKDE